MKIIAAVYQRQLFYSPYTLFWWNLYRSRRGHGCPLVSARAHPREPHCAPRARGSLRTVDSGGRGAALCRWPRLEATAALLLLRAPAHANRTALPARGGAYAAASASVSMSSKGNKWGRTAGTGSEPT